ncbi:MAG: peptidoglycan recognition family protein [Pseudanabaenaceae cyanobacterium bins.39]|nr:peptidoglycan recognition family protein [Pseudanabaenaceae cyanobacterium bins.39]
MPQSMIRRLTTIAIFCLTFITIIGISEFVRAKRSEAFNIVNPVSNINQLNQQNRQKTKSPINPLVNSQSKISQNIAPSSQVINFSTELNQFAPIAGCELKPPSNPSLPAKLSNQPISLTRFRQPATVANTNNTANTADKMAKSETSANSVANSTKSASNAYNPREIVALAANSNYGDRYLLDLKGNKANLPPIIVLHETVGSANSVINYFQSFQSNEDYQASYHTMIALDGTIIYFVPPDKRAFGAGNSVFVSKSISEAIQTNPKFPSSVNNFAYHISLETPEDGINDEYSHSGYTDWQYRSLAWLVARTNVPLERITTHRAVDRSGSRIDPRSFDWNLFQKYLSELPKSTEIIIGCTEQQDKQQDILPAQAPSNVKPKAQKS